MAAGKCLYKLLEILYIRVFSMTKGFNFDEAPDIIICTKASSFCYWAFVNSEIMEVLALNYIAFLTLT